MSNLLSMRVDLVPGKAESVNREELITKLFSGIHINNRNSRWDGNTYTLSQADLIKSKILQRFGASVSIDDLDKNILELIENNDGYLEAKSDDSIEIKSDVVTAEIEMICQLASSSLSHDLVGVLKSLLSNINEILTSSSYYGKTSKIYVNLFHTKDDEILLVHVRLETQINKRGVKIFFLGGEKKSLLINIALRKIGICRSYIDKIIE